MGTDLHVFKEISIFPFSEHASCGQIAKIYFSADAVLELNPDL